ncbi:long-chain fatty acid--CoA ligase [Rhodococcoides fascians A25f]|uniref:acyl-CoA synthetase n=1 Tax=Rhodococcoides fascians TaxID=1828 RepID=UPI0005600FEA|nr:long-chain fatty acid--CoA ligase [Rhodococcus fascians]QII07368.1 long-chain fatty acid--CoA ligase [Rhodococcus fascians A25f]
MINFATVVDRNAARFPDRIAVSETNREVTHEELRTRVDALAVALVELGIGRGDIIGVLLYNHIEFIETMFAANRIGAAIVPLNYRLSDAEWTFILQHAEAVAIVTEAEFADKIDVIGPHLPLLRTKVTLSDPSGPTWNRYSDLVDRHLGETTDLADVDPSELQRLMYTSGTTSRPKGVKISHENLIFKNLAHILEFSLTSSDTTLVCGPLYHVGGMDLPGLATLHVGGSLRLLRKFDPNAVIDAIEQERPTNIWLAPSMMNAVLQLPNIEDRDTRSIRFITGGGEKMPVPLLDRIAHVFPASWFADAYGLTETVSGDTINDAEHMRSKVGSVGRAVAHTQIAIFDDDGKRVQAGQLGEIAVRGPKVTSGYWRDEQATEKALKNGWFHTGDIGRLDTDGFLYIEDRKKDMIVSGGENIASPEVERVLYEFPDVIEAAVIGVPDDRWGEVPKAFVVLRPGSTAGIEDLKEFCRGRLAKYKVPSSIVYIESLPRTPSGKVLKRTLREAT